MLGGFAGFVLLDGDEKRVGVGVGAHQFHDFGQCLGGGAGFRRDIQAPVLEMHDGPHGQGGGHERGGGGEPAGFAEFVDAVHVQPHSGSF